MLTVKELNDKLKKLDYDLTKLSDDENTLFNRIITLREHDGKLVEHFKKKLYLILGVAEHTETGEELVLYKAMYGDYKTYARPIDMFLSKVDKEKYPDVSQEYRFEFLSFL